MPNGILLGLHTNGVWAENSNWCMGVNGEALQLHEVYKKPYFVLQVTRESVSVLQVTRESVSVLQVMLESISGTTSHARIHISTASHARIRIRYYKSRALRMNMQ